jgi:hypothetical protein
MCHRRESWSSDIRDEGGIKIEHDCIKIFLAIGQVDVLDEKHHVGTDFVLHVLQAHAEQIKAPKKSGLGMVSPLRRHIQRER